MRLRTLRAMAFGTLVVGITVSAVPPPAASSESGKRNTAIGLTAGSLYLFARDKDTLGLATGAGAAYAWHQYNKERDSRVRRQAYSAGRRTSTGAPRYSTRQTAVRRSSPSAASSSGGYTRPVAAVQKADPAFMSRMAVSARPTGDWALSGALDSAPVLALVPLSAPESVAAPAVQAAAASRQPESSAAAQGTANPWVVAAAAFALGIVVAYGVLGVDWPRFRTAWNAARRDPPGAPHYG